MTWSDRDDLAMPGRSMSSPLPAPKGTRMGEAVVPGREEVMGIIG